MASLLLTIVMNIIDQINLTPLDVLDKLIILNIL